MSKVYSSLKLTTLLDTTRILRVYIANLRPAADLLSRHTLAVFHIMLALHSLLPRPLVMDPATSLEGS